jgi:hypothetical protein
MSKKIEDIVHDPDKGRPSAHKPKGAIYGPQTSAMWNGNAPMPGKRECFANQIVMAKDFSDQSWKGGQIILKDTTNAAAPIYTVKLGPSHNNAIIQTTEVTGSPQSELK